MFNYTFSKEDVITYLLYNVYANKKVKNKGKKAMWIFGGYFVLLAIVCYYLNDITTGIAMLCLAVLLTLYNLFLRTHLMNKSIAKIAVRDLNGMIGANVQLEIKEDHLQLSDQVGAYQYLFSGILLISELHLYYFIKLNNSHTILIPKINDQLEQAIHGLISRHSLPYKLDSDFKL